MKSQLTDQILNHPRGVLYLLLFGVLVNCLTLHRIRAEQPNIILCMADDLGWGDVGFNGNRIIRTPHLDEMAASGLKFTRFYSGAPVCSPTRGSVLTGKHPYRYGIFSANVGHLPESEYTLTQMLKQAGYTTGHFGKWHLGTLTQTGRDSNRGGARNLEHFAPPWRRGFDATFSTEAKVPTFDPLLKPRGSKRNAWWDALSPGEPVDPFGTSYWSQGERVTETLRGDDSQIIMDRALEFIHHCTQDGKPFLAVIWFHAPHLPVVADSEHRAMYEGRDKYAQNYYGCTTALDEQVGRLRQQLRKLQVAENTMLWFCADNGPEGQADKAPGTAGSLRGRKRDLFEGGIRVPGLLEWPAKISAGTVVNAPCVTSDYLPTIAELLDISLPEDLRLDGESLLPVIQAERSVREHPIGFQSARQLAWMEERYKLIFRPNKGTRGHWADISNGQWMLFDIKQDPGEQNNLIHQQPQQADQMRKQLLAWVQSCRDEHGRLLGKNNP